MDKFPDEINKTTCFKNLTDNQRDLTKETRKNFTDQINQAIIMCNKTTSLKFPEKLWPEHRVQITAELLERFGELTVNAKNGKAVVTKITTDKSDIPTNIDSIKIEF